MDPTNAHTISAALKIADSVDGNETDYGSDFDSEAEQFISELLADLAAGSGAPLVLEDIEQDDSPTSSGRQPAARVPKSAEERSSQQSVHEELGKYFEERRRHREVSMEVEYDEPSRKAWTVPPKPEDDDPAQAASVEPRPRGSGPHARSPLERFRKPPKKPLSVTDLVSPGWCELQYWYALTKHGRKQRTPAMKQGTAVHKALEEQVHRTVPVAQVTTREEMWGLRMWNVIQGIRTLRAIGMTRELEVWGIIDGEVVNGIIDELSFTCPDPELEEQQDGNQQNPAANKEDGPNTQSAITDFFAATASKSLEDTSAWLGSLGPERKVYITDVKTRGAKSLPTGPSLRPTIMQLMLYRRMLASLATNSVDAGTVFFRYNLDASAPFSDGFIAEVGSIDHNLHEDAYSDDGEDPFGAERDSVGELLAHNSLSQLWQLMMAEFRKAMPQGEASIGSVLQAEFRGSWDGKVIGTKTFRYDEKQLNGYLTDGMQWWRGEREARGVDIEEAFKCKICEFNETCTWRLGKIEEAIEKQRLKKANVTKSVI